MKLTKYQLFSLFFLILIIITTLLTLTIPFSKMIYLNKNINIIFFTPDPFLVEINTNNKGLVIKEILTKKDFIRSKFDTAFQIINEYSSEKENVAYFEICKTDFELLIESIKKWRENPKFIFVFIRKIISTKTNLNLFEKINIATELLKTRKDNILRVKITVINQDNLEKKDHAIPSASITIHPSKTHLLKRIINDMRKNQIDIIEEKRLRKNKSETYIEIKNEDNIDIAKRAIFILNSKKDIPIKINPKIIYDININIGEDFE